MANNELRQRVEDRLRDLGIGPVEAARSVEGLERNYIRDLVEGKKESFANSKVELVARALKWTPTELLGLSGNNSEKTTKNERIKTTRGPREKLIAGEHLKMPIDEPKVMEVVPGAQLVGEQNLPVFGTAQGGSGALIVTNDAVDWVVRPDPLLRVKDGYGMIVTGDSMDPVHKHGSIALVNPHLPWRSGDTCIFRSHGDNGDNLAVIKELRRYTDDTWYVRQYNPPKDYTLKRSEWQICHVTIGNYFSR